MKNSVKEVFGTNEYRFLRVPSRLLKWNWIENIFLFLKPSVRGVFLVTSLVLSTFIFSLIIWIAQGSGAELYVKVAFGLSFFFMIVALLIYMARLCIGKFLILINKLIQPQLDS